jgi:Spy/CpxP family protein refolding chaperone
MKIKILVGVLVFLIVLNLVTIGSYVYFRWMAPPPPSAPDIPAMMREHFRRHHPRLEPEQRQQLRNLHRKFMSETASDREAILNLRRQIFKMLTAEQLDTVLLRQKMDSINWYRQRIEEKGLRMLILSRHVLTPPQRMEFYRMLEQLAGFMMHRPYLRERKFPARVGPPDSEMKQPIPDKPFREPKPQRRMP